MSALPPKANVVRYGGNIRFVPKADKVRCNKITLLDHPVGASLKTQRARRPSCSPKTRRGG